MLLSGEILAKELNKYVVYQAIERQNGMRLANFQVWDASVTQLTPEYAYLVAEEAWDAILSFPPGSTVLYCGRLSRQALPVPEISLLVVSGMTLLTLVNHLIRIFQKYTDLDEQLGRAIEEGQSLQQVIDVAAELIGTPVNMLDMNHNTIAFSTTLVPEGDILWDAMMEGYGYRHYSIVCRSIPSIAQMDTNGINLYQGQSNISGRYIRVYLLRIGTRGVATFGLHKLTDYDQPFEPETIQLGDYVYRCLLKNIDHFPQIQQRRGNLFEQFLVDLLDNKVTEEGQLEDSQMADVVKVNDCYTLGMVLFSERVPQTDYFLMLMDYLEAHVPYCRCAVYQAKLYFVSTLHGGHLLSPEQKQGLDGFLKKYACSCLLSSPFRGLLEVGRHKEILWAVRNYIPPQGEAGRIWYFYEFAYQYALELLSQQIPLRSACHPAILALQRYDEKNESNYVETLQEYLRSDCNVTKASNLLHMHRNTLLYRINKIEKSILGMELDKNELREELKFSFRCLEFAARYQQGGGAESTEKEREVL